jgi:pilus assembly protein Flp/PilA
VEYGLIIAIMASALIGGFGHFSGSLQDMFGFIETALEQPAP